MTLQTRSLILQAKQGDTKSRDALLAHNTGLIWTAVRRINRRGYDAQDLFQVGAIGLLKAIERFDVSLGTTFSTYALPLILGELKRFLRDDGLIKVSRTLKEQAACIRRAQRELDQTLGRSPTLKELSQRTGIPAPEVSAALAAPLSSGENTLSLEAPIPTGQAGKTLTLQESLPDPGPGEQERVEHMALQESLGHLPEEERALILLRYFENKTQTEVGRLLGMSQVQVSRLEKKVLKKLRQDLTQE